MDDRMDRQDNSGGFREQGDARFEDHRRSNRTLPVAAETDYARSMLTGVPAVKPGLSRAHRPPSSGEREQEAGQPGSVNQAAEQRPTVAPRSDEAPGVRRQGGAPTGGTTAENRQVENRQVEHRPVADPSAENAVEASGLRFSDESGPVSGPPMLRQAAPKPRTGWRALAYDMTGGRWNPGPSPTELREREREARIAGHLRGKHVTAFFCLKGGISKTSTTAATSLALADLRPDPVVAIDANPDAGDLAERLVGESHAGISALAAHVDEVRSLEDLSRYTVTAGRLTVLPGEPNPVLGDSLRAEDFERVLGVVGTYYSLVQVDCGTGVTHPLMRGILAHTNTAVIPAAWSITGARRAAETIEWLANNGFEHLAKSSIVVLTAKDVVSKRVDREAVMRHLGGAADLVVVPADPHVADGAQLVWEQLHPATQEAFLDIAAAITSRFKSE